jgi:hypothetical protein
VLSSARTLEDIRQSRPILSDERGGCSFFRRCCCIIGVCSETGAPLARGADTGLRDNRGKTALAIALDNGDKRTVEALRAAGANN